jgi:5-methyltetrahydropteroyltriglutamate--homocysteine methyltransferase
LKPMYRADQGGSYLRAPWLLDARAEHEAGKISLERLRELEDTAVLELLEMQREVGIDVFSDGEVRRESWSTGTVEAVDGLERITSPSAGGRPIVWHEVDGTVREELAASAALAVRKVTSSGRIAGHESRFLLDHADGPFKITVPSPVITATFIYNSKAEGQAYNSYYELLDDLTGIVRDELVALTDEGVPYIQVDEGFTGFIGEYWSDLIRESGDDPEKRLEAAIASENACYSAVDRDRVTLAMHLCRGNSRSRWAGSGAYDTIAERVFNELDVDRFLLEYDSERAGGFEPLRFVPAGKIAVLGLISTKVPELESEDDLLRKIEEAATYLPIEQLALSPQCGFASVKAGNLISTDDQRRKLELTVKVARRVWDD